VVESHNDLAIVVDLGGTSLHELQSHWPTVIVRHAVVRGECDIVAGLDYFTRSEADRVSLDDLFGEGLGVGRSGGLLNGQRSGGIEGAFGLRWEDVLPSWVGGSISTKLRRSYGNRSRASNEGLRLPPRDRDRDGIESNQPALKICEWVYLGA